jgi:hypothetical protein
MRSTPKRLNRREMIRKGSLSVAGMAAVGDPTGNQPANQ